MQNIRSFSAYTTGEKHRKVGKVCQDYALHSEDIEKGIYVCVLSDGHGSNRYFRSHIGAELLTEITLNAIISFLNTIDKTLLDNSSYAMPSRTTIAEKGLNIKAPAVDKTFRQLFASIIAKWNEAIYTDWKNSPPGSSEMEKAGLENEHIKDFLDDKNIELAYGCTLLAIVRTPYFWIGIQLGDGKCIAFDGKGNWSEPIPWDEQCSGNLTTSLCQPNPIDSFRYAYGTQFFPVMFIGSDGMDGAYGNDEEIAMQNLALLYGGIIKSFAGKDFEEALTDIKDTLPQLSAKGICQDDISVGGIIDINAILEVSPLLIKKELEQIRQKHETIAKETEAKQKEVMDLEIRINQKKESFSQIKEQLQDAKEDKEKHEQIWKKVYKEKEIAQQKWEDLQSSIEKLEAEINQLGNDLSFEKNYFRKIIKEEQDVKKKIEELEKEFLHNNRDEITNNETESQNKSVDNKSENAQ